MPAQLHRRLACLACLLLASSLIPHSSSLTPACVPGDRSFHGYSFLNMGILPLAERQALAPLFLRFDKLYAEHFASVAKASRDENVAEWVERLCREALPEDVAHVVYKASAAELEGLLTATKSESLPPPPSLRENSFARFLFEKKCPETVEYLVFAKKCEPHVTANDQWKVLERDKEAMKKLIGEGRRLFRKTSSHYIRLRFAYQVIRLAHYSHEYERTLQLCDELLPQVDRVKSHWTESVIPWWIEGHRAGALLRLGERVEAAHAFSRVFENCPGRRASAYQSFSIKTDEEWDACLRRCASDSERATLYALRAASEESRAVEEMEKIYTLDPLGKHLDALLVQEIRKMERNLLGLEFNPKREGNKRRFDVPRKYAGDYVISLQKFARRVRQEGRVARPQLWLLAEGYLEFLAGDFYAAEKTFDEAAKQVSDPVLQEQLRAFRLALQIAAFEQPTDEVEELAYHIIQDSALYKQYRSFPDFLKDKMAFLFRQHRQEGMAFLSRHPLEDLKPNPSLELLDDLIAVALKPQQTSLERLFIQKNPVNALLDMKAVFLMSTGQFEAAMETYRRIPAELWDELGQFDPFRETTKDCINCVPRADTGLVVASVNRGELIENLLDLEYKARGDLEGAARHYYRLGLAHYNISYFGYEWEAMDLFRSGSTWSKLHQGRSGVYDHWKYAIGNRENTDLSRAFFCFEKSRLLAADPELAARAAFQAARCEQKIYFQTEGYKPEPCCNRIPRLPEEYQVNFSRLKEMYVETEFYRQVVRECKYFERYAAR